MSEVQATEKLPELICKVGMNLKILFDDSAWNTETALKLTGKADAKLKPEVFLTLIFSQSREPMLKEILRDLRQLANCFRRINSAIGDIGEALRPSSFITPYKLNVGLWEIAGSLQKQILTTDPELLRDNFVIEEDNKKYKMFQSTAVAVIRTIELMKLEILVNLAMNIKKRSPEAVKGDEEPQSSEAVKGVEPESSEALKDVEEPQSTKEVIGTDERLGIGFSDFYLQIIINLKPDWFNGFVARFVLRSQREVDGVTKTNLSEFDYIFKLPLMELEGDGPSNSEISENAVVF